MQRIGDLNASRTRQVAIEVELLLQLRELFVSEIGSARVIRRRRQAAAAQAAWAGTSHGCSCATIDGQAYAQSEAHTGCCTRSRWIIGQQQRILDGGQDSSRAAAHVQVTIQLIVVHVGR